MKIKNISNIDKFFEIVKKCEGSVELVSNEGDCLNLKSQLTRYVALAKVFSDGKIAELEIKFSNPDDVKRITEYLISK